MSIISPTLANLFKISYYTVMNFEDVCILLWEYIDLKNLLIDGRFILLNDELSKVIRPECKFPENKKNVEQYIVIKDVVDMHLDPIFIELDVNFRMEIIKKNIASRKINRFFKQYCNNLHEKLWKPPDGKMIIKSWKLIV